MCWRRSWESEEVDVQGTGPEAAFQLFVHMHVVDIQWAELQKCPRLVEYFRGDSRPTGVVAARQRSDHPITISVWDTKSM